MTRIFLSYRREDSRWATHQLARILKEQSAPGDEVFIDAEDIPAGTDYALHLETQIAQCDFLLAVIGPSWLYATFPRSSARRLEDERDWVRIEISTALKRGIPVVPVLLDDTELPGVHQLPEPLAELPRRQAERVRLLTLDADATRLARKLGLVAPPKPEAVVTPLPEPKEASKEKRDRPFFLLRVGPLQLMLSIAASVAFMVAIYGSMQLTTEQAAARERTARVAAAADEVSRARKEEAESRAREQHVFHAAFDDIAYSWRGIPSADFVPTNESRPYGFEVVRSGNHLSISYARSTSRELTARPTLVSMLLMKALAEAKLQRPQKLGASGSSASSVAGCGAAEVGLDLPVLNSEWSLWTLSIAPSHKSEADEAWREIKAAMMGCSFDSTGVLPLPMITKPILNPPAKIVQPFGDGDHAGIGTGSSHKGIDLTSTSGAAIFAPLEGVVISAGVRGGYGRHVTIETAEGVRFLFAHLNSITVKVDQKVMAGQKIGTMGSTGRSTEPMLHLEVFWRDQPLDPQKVEGLLLVREASTLGVSAARRPGR